MMAFQLRPAPAAPPPKLSLTTKTLQMRPLLLLTALLLIPLTAGAQGTGERIFSVGISVLDEHVGIPFQYLPGDRRNSFNPGLALSLETSRERYGTFQFSHALELGYYHHAGNEQAGYISYKPRLGLQFFRLLDLHLVPGIGYARSYPTVQSFAQNGDRYELATNYGVSHFMPSLGVGIGIDLEDISGLPLRFHVRHEGFLLLPAIHTFSHAGVLVSF